MITGKNSAIKGFFLFFWLIVLLLGVIAGSLTHWLFLVASIINLCICGYLIYRLYKQWSDN